jgi:hypothetical protein
MVSFYSYTYMLVIPHGGAHNLVDWRHLSVVFQYFSRMVQSSVFILHNIARCYLNPESYRHSDVYVKS